MITASSTVKGTVTITAFKAGYSREGVVFAPLKKIYNLYIQGIQQWLVVAVIPDLHNGESVVLSDKVVSSNNDTNAPPVVFALSWNPRAIEYDGATTTITAKSEPGNATVRANQAGYTKTNGDIVDPAQEISFIVIVV